MFDIIYRNILSPESLREKRRDIQVHRLDRAVQLIQSSQTQKRTIQTISKEHNNELESFVKGLMDDKAATPTIVGITTVATDASNVAQNELMLVLKQKDSQSDSQNDSTIVHVPFLEFGSLLSQAFEEKLTSIALCFIADASSGLGSEILGKMIQDCGAGMALIQEPAWMTSFAKIAQEQNDLDKKRTIPNRDMQKILFGLCRLDAWRVRNQVGESRTVAITLPGQSCTAPLLPALQKIFPCERHVFVYDGGIDSVARGVRVKNGKGLCGSDNEDSASSVMPRNISTTTPIAPLSSITPVSKFNSLLAKLPQDKSDIMEAWLSSTDAFLKLKHAEKKTGYVPFVCRLGFLMGQVGRLGNGKVDVSDIAMKNVLQYMTGSRSRSLKDEILENAKKAMMHVRKLESEIQQTANGETLLDAEKEVIEECAFAHKGILIENKTLMDTVQPKEEWSLKAAKKLTSCACCMPGEGDEDSDEEDNDNDDSLEQKVTSDDSVKRAKTTASTGFVDGKTTFAFDPTRFTGM